MLLNTDDCYIPGPIEENSKVGKVFLSGLSYLLGSLSNDDGHGKENVERAITLLRACLIHREGDPGLVGLVSFVFTL